MGRFATTVPYYNPYREPYPHTFFRMIAEHLHLDGSQRLADIGCGPAPLAIGFAPFVRTCIGIDPEPAMLRAAREQALEAGVGLELVEARIEHVAEDIGQFELVTIGRALHWMEPQATLLALDRIVVPGGAILICAATPPESSNSWLVGYNEVRSRWVDHTGEERYSADAEERFSNSRFRFEGRIAVSVDHRVTIDELIRRSLSRSTTSPQVLGDRLADFAKELAAALRPFADQGVLREQIEASARIFR
jgi:ubiquinone/menaquinone biosynthesis C-methylase UbiE